MLKIALHLFTDGRDTAPQSAYEYLSELENFLKRFGHRLYRERIGQILRDGQGQQIGTGSKKPKTRFLNARSNVCTEKPSEVVKRTL